MSTSVPPAATHSSTSSEQPRPRDRALFALLLLALFALQSVAVHHYYTTLVPGGNDFYPRWAGARALLLDGQDPYSDAVTREIEGVLDPRGQRTNSFNFAFPLPVIFLFWPLAYTSYAWAQAVWMVTIQWVAIGLVVALLAWLRWQPRPTVVALLILATLTFYPVVRTIFLGQFTLHVTLFVLLALLFLQRGRDGWAGFCLSLASVKPQMVLLLAPWLILWAIGQRRWGFLRGLLAGGALLLAASLALVPDWPVGFLAGLVDYKAVAAGRDPLQILLDLAWPGAPDILRFTAVALLLVLLFVTWRRGWRQTGARFERALFWTIVISLLAFFQTGTTNQVLMLIPLFLWAYQAGMRWGPWPVVVMTLILLVAPWVLFLETLQGDYESELLFLPLPLLGALVLTAQEVAAWRTERLSEVQTEVAQSEAGR